MTEQTSERARPEPIKAVPVRHPWRWVGAAVIIVLAAMFIHMLVTNDHFQWKFIFVSSGPGQRGAMFTPPVLAGLRGTLLLTVFSMLIGVALGVILAIMRLSPSPILRWAAFGYVWFFRAVPRLVLAVLFGNLGILWPRIGVGLPFDAQIGGSVRRPRSEREDLRRTRRRFVEWIRRRHACPRAVRGRLHG